MTSIIINITHKRDDDILYDTPKLLERLNIGLKMKKQKKKKLGHVP
jgi:hypothetical protein